MLVASTEEHQQALGIDHGESCFGHQTPGGLSAAVSAKGKSSLGLFIPRGHRTASRDCITQPRLLYVATASHGTVLPNLLQENTLAIRRPAACRLSMNLRPTCLLQS